MIELLETLCGLVILSASRVKINVLRDINPDHELVHAWHYCYGAFAMGLDWPAGLWESEEA